MLKFLKKHADHLFLLLTFILITASAIYFRQPPYRYLPLCVSMIIYLMQSRISRYAYLLGSLNSVLYAVVYVGLGIYASAASALLLSFPMQMVIFFMWKKRADGQTTYLRRMSLSWRLGTTAGFILAWVGLYFLLRTLNSTAQILDNTATLLGILVSLLAMFSFIEYTYLQIPSYLLNIMLQAWLMKENPGQITYVILSAYGVVLAVQAVFRAQAIYKRQQSEKTA